MHTLCLRLKELLDKIGNAEFITTLDLTKGYCIGMHPEERAKTAFTSPRGLYQCDHAFWFKWSFSHFSEYDGWDIERHRIICFSIFGQHPYIQ